ncbi:MAG: diacylglycerol/lipid kinase family protein [Roseburia sp.]
MATDGEFSVCCGYGVARWSTFFLLPFLVKGKHTGFKCFDIHNCRKFSVDLEKPMVLHADGEYCGDVTHAEFRCLSGKLNILL